MSQRRCPRCDQLLWFGGMEVPTVCPRCRTVLGPAERLAVAQDGDVTTGSRVLRYGLWFAAVAVVGVCLCVAAFELGNWVGGDEEKRQAEERARKAEEDHQRHVARIERERKEDEERKAAEQKRKEEEDRDPVLQLKRAEEKRTAWYKGPWKVKADPGPRPPEILGPANAPIEYGIHNPILPYQPAPFLAVRVDELGILGKPSYQVYDLAKWAKLGPVLEVNFVPLKATSISPDGRWLAVNKGTIDEKGVRCFGPFVDRPFAVETRGGQFVDRAEFASGRRLVLMSRLRVPQQKEFGMRFEVHDVETRRFLASGDTLRMFHPRHSAFTPGGAYLAQVIPNDEGRQCLAFWDLGSGEPAGAIDLQTSKETAAVAISPDGKLVSVLFVTPEKEPLWHVATWKLLDRSFVSEHDLPKDRVKLDKEQFAFGRAAILGGKAMLQWLPDGKGWLLFGYLVVGLEKGDVIGEVERPEGAEMTVVERVFRGGRQVIHWGGPPFDVTLLDVPKR